MSKRTLEVTFTLDASIVLSGIVCKLNANPNTGREAGLASKTDHGLAAVAEKDLSALGQLRQGHVVINRHLMLRHFVVVDGCLLGDACQNVLRDVF